MRSRWQPGQTRRQTLAGHPLVRHGLPVVCGILLLIGCPAIAEPAPAEQEPAPTEQKPAPTEQKPDPPSSPGADATVPPAPAAPEGATASAAGPAPAAPAVADLAAEARAATELARGRRAGEVVKLRVGEREVLALWRPRTSAPARGSVVLLHGERSTVDDPAIVGALRQDLPTHGFASLALMLPVPAGGAAPAGSAAWQPDVAARLSAAVAWLEERNAPVRALVGHGAGAAFVKRILEEPGAQPEGLEAVVLIDSEAGMRESEAVWSGPLALPVLDIVGNGAGTEALLRSEERRSSAMRTGGAEYRSVRIPGVINDWYPARGRLVAAVRGFLLRFTTPEVLVAP
ncbi:MAG TPA: hypothetical protein DCY89_08270 [Gammaproteobacteria bacterium]|nr:hypothetical protein [Gammaproteobacteria bacterium]